MGHIEPIGQVKGETREALRQALLYAYSTFSVYRDLFRRSGISQGDISGQDPLAVLQRLAPLEGQTFYDLVEESIRTGEGIIDLETSSGTTGQRKRRVISYDDDVSETEFLAELFSTCGVDGSDSVACLDVGPLTLMVSFTKAFDLLGVKEAYAYSVAPDFKGSLEGLVRLDPSVIVSSPSIIERCFEALAHGYRGATDRKLRAVIYAGEPLARPTRDLLEHVLGVEVFGYYGASETSALGIECPMHDGIHLFTDRNIIEVPVASPGSVGSIAGGEVLVTTLRQRSLPLLRYSLKDVVEVKPGACPCGLEYPRVEIIGRPEDTVSVLGLKVSYGSVLSAAYDDAGDSRLMQLVLSKAEGDKLTIVLPDKLQPEESRIRDSLLEREPDLEFLVAGGFLGLEFSFVDKAHFGAGEKLRKVVDPGGDDVDHIHSQRFQPGPVHAGVPGSP